ncbi:hypothetical protein CBM2587_P10011 [Cupriavidus taiwanensis]|uniref:Uncharacterized protein n=1 Tax=Cupriavidus taiwanensis TaxID=164546 RepID=A0A375CJV9_9BURK|nr:hypothetical protein CBM2587_P10011 [Cupriavidus taiwanensis]
MRKANLRFDSQQWPSSRSTSHIAITFQARHWDYAGLYISRPFQGRLQPSDKFLELSRRLISPDGSPALGTVA